MDEISSLQTHVSIDERFEEELDSAWLEMVAQAGLVVAEIAGEAEVSLLITDDETVRELNREYRGLDETTDVLSFSTEFPGHWEGEGDGPMDSRFRGNDETGGNDGRGRYDEGDGEFVLPPGLPTPLGEIIVSWPQAQRQAVERRESPSDELAHLIVHGALHLVGHDHEEPEETARMQVLEKKALRLLSIGSAARNGGLEAS